MTFLSSSAEGYGEGDSAAVTGDVVEVVTPFKVTWNLSAEEYGQCVTAANGTCVFSPFFKLPNGIYWALRLYPRGMQRSDEGYVSLKLKLDLEASGAETRRFQVEYILNAFGTEKRVTRKFDATTTCGFGKFCHTPSFAPGGQCSVHVQLTMFDISSHSKKVCTAAEWFKALPKAEYCQTLKREGYDSIAAIRLLDDAELQRMGVLAGHRRLVLKSIVDLRKLE